MIPFDKAKFTHALNAATAFTPTQVTALADAIEAALSPAEPPPLRATLPEPPRNVT